MYAVTNFKSKKALKEAVANGKKVEVFSPGPFGWAPPKSGLVNLEGPHYPEPHRWYASAILVDGFIVKVS